MTKVTFVSDIHYSVPNHLVDLGELVESVENADPEAVIVLGDVIHENEDTNENIENLEHVVDTLESVDPDVHYVPGNHDRNALSRITFREVTGTELDSTVEVGDETMLLLDTAFKSSYENLSMMGQRGVEAIEEAGDDTIVCTHFPIGYTRHYQDSHWFSSNPEAVFPIDKNLFEQSSVSPSSVLCGHMHLDQSVSWVRDDTWYRCIEPYTDFDTETDEMTGVHNGFVRTFDVEALV